MRANEDAQHFAWAVSHDLQEPLRTITSFSQLLCISYQGRLDPQAEKHFKLIVQTADRMNSMISDLLRFARAAGAEQTYEEGVSLEGALTVALHNLGVEILSSGAIIRRDPLPEVRGHAGQFTQVFQNLIGNSLKYRKAGIPPEVHVSAERRKAEWVIRVRDNGIGFEPEQAERIFGVFRRLHRTEYPGSGIGLAICKRIVERRGGVIAATAKSGEGATFSFSIPDAPELLLPLEQELPLEAVQAVTPGASVVPTPFEELFQTIDLAHAIVRDLSGKITVWTRGAERLFGYSKREAIGQQVHELLRVESPARIEEIEAELLRNGEWQGHLRKFRKDGSPFGWRATGPCIATAADGPSRSLKSTTTSPL